MTTLIVFARRPRAGAVKRRLARAVGRHRAAALYATLLAHTLTLAEASGCARRVLMPAAADDVRWFRALLAPRGWQVRAQCTGTLGRRMERALDSALAAGQPAILIGSDMLDATAGDVARAARALAGVAAAVIGPAADGGYWLIGLARPLPGLFADLPWGGPEVGARTIERLVAARVVCLRLAPRHDLDRGRDLLTAAVALSGPWRARDRAWRRSVRCAARSAPRDR